MSRELESFISRGQQRFMCPACPFDHYDKEKVIKHWYNVHHQGGEPAEPSEPTGLLDAKGKAITHGELQTETGIPDVGGGEAHSGDVVSEFYFDPEGSN